jgi:hypothetical protein
LDTKAFKVGVQIKPELGAYLLKNIRWEELQIKL